MIVDGEFDFEEEEVMRYVSRHYPDISPEKLTKITEHLGRLSCSIPGI
jgi:hypothetical protein